LRYILKSYHQEGEFPFVGNINGDAKDKNIRKYNEAGLGAFKKSVILPTRKVYQQRVSTNLSLGLSFPLRLY